MLVAGHKGYLDQFINRENLQFMWPNFMLFGPALIRHSARAVYSLPNTITAYTGTDHAKTPA
jgi:hypothetical protein